MVGVQAEAWLIMFLCVSPPVTNKHRCYIWEIHAGWPHIELLILYQIKDNWSVVLTNQIISCLVETTKSRRCGYAYDLTYVFFFFLTKYDLTYVQVNFTICVETHCWHLLQLMDKIVSLLHFFFLIFFNIFFSFLGWQIAFYNSFAFIFETKIAIKYLYLYEFLVKQLELSLGLEIFFNPNIVSGNAGIGPHRHFSNVICRVGLNRKHIQSFWR